MPTVTSRVIVEIYRGIDFPTGWADKPDVMNVGMARDLLVSVAAMFDADLKPIALCWRMDGREERFVHAEANDSEDSSLLDELHCDLADESTRLGASDLLATMLWAPDEIRPDQGQPIREITFIRGRYTRPNGVSGWNVATLTLVAKASDLLFMTRRVDEGLSMPMPTSIEDMRQNIGSDDANILIVMPGGVASIPETNVGRNVVFFFLGLIALGALITAYLVNSGR